MCNLYSMTRNREAILRLFRISPNRAAAFAPLDAIFPGHLAPVIRQAGDGERELVQMSWGYVLLQKGKAPRRVTNVRDDTLRTSPFWRSSFEERRCLVPATSFCEPNGNVKPATWHWFALKGKSPTVDAERPVFAFPGIWRRYKGPLRKDGETVDLDVYAFLTTTPNSLVATVNHERMPVLLNSAEACDLWLNGDEDEAFALAREYPPDAMRIVREGFDKADPVVSVGM
jgi:putative SOS response-associated peptidase YedK